MKAADKRHPILLMDDEELFLQGAETSLQLRGFQNILCASSPEDFFAQYPEPKLEAAVLDINMPGMDGLEVLDRLRMTDPDLPVIMVTAVNDVETAVECMRRGAVNYLLKPLEEEQFVAQLQSALELRTLQRENRSLKNSLLDKDLKHPDVFVRIVTGDVGMQRIFRYVEAVSSTPFPVLVTGETGVGKEALAESIHDCSEKTGKFVAVNVAGLDDTLFSDTLFGHLKGAFTSAEGSRTGLVEEASGGTLFLDEVGDLSPSSQLKLLRLLQTGDYYPLGQDHPSRADVRVVVATNRELGDPKQSPDFRRDLYFRLRTHRIHLPPLRERTGDIPLLAAHFLQSVRSMLGGLELELPQSVLDQLATYGFPGNVRELQSIIFDSATQSAGTGMLNPATVDSYIRMEESIRSGSDVPSSSAQLTRKKFPTLKESGQRLVEEALRLCNGKQSEAAVLLGISRQALNKRIRGMD